MLKIGSKFKSKSSHAYEAHNSVRVTTSEGKPFSSGYFTTEQGMIEGKVVGYAGDQSDGWVCVEDSKRRPYFITHSVFESMNDTK